MCIGSKNLNRLKDPFMTDGKRKAFFSVHANKTIDVGIVIGIIPARIGSKGYDTIILSSGCQNSPSMELCIVCSYIQVSRMIYINIRINKYLTV